MVPTSLAPEGDVELPEGQTDIDLYKLTLMLTKLRRILESQGRYSMALRILATGSAFYGGNLSSMPDMEWSKFVLKPARAEDRHESEMIQTIVCHLAFAWTLATQRRAEESETELSKVSTIMNNLANIIGNAHDYFPRGNLYFDWVVLINESYPAQKVDIDRFNALESRARMLGDYSLVRRIKVQALVILKAQLNSWWPRVAEDDIYMDEVEFFDPWGLLDAQIRSYLEFEESEYGIAMHLGGIFDGDEFPHGFTRQ